VPSFRFITFLSDYGLENEFVGVCRAVIKRFAPDVEILDIAHGIPPQDITAGATVLAHAVPYMPPAVHFAVVDPGVGTERRAVVIESLSGAPLVGPDNGLLWLATEALGGPSRAWEIKNESLKLQPPSRTFHGRDLFAPVAARLATGMAGDEVGPEIAIDSLKRLVIPPATVDDDHIHSHVVQIDHFGNLQLNVHRQELEGIGVLLGDAVEIRLGGRSFTAPYDQTFSAVPDGRLVLLEDSYRWIAIAVNKGNAQHFLEAGRGDPVVIARIRRSAAASS